jgi:hypothetical protein
MNKRTGKKEKPVLARKKLTRNNSDSKDEARVVTAGRKKPQKSESAIISHKWQIGVSQKLFVLAAALVSVL